MKQFSRLALALVLAVSHGSAFAGGVSPTLAARESC